MERDDDGGINPSDTPRGMTYYNLEILTDLQRKKVNNLRVQTVRDDETYLAHHPQVTSQTIPIHSKQCAALG